MNTTTLEVGAAAPGRSRLAIGLWWLALAVGVYFVAKNVPHYLTIDEAVYGPYFWPRAGYLVPHLLAGLVAIVLGPLQFWPRIRNGYPKVHRVTGRIYLSAIVIGSLAGMGLALTTAVTPTYAAGLFALACAWLATSAMAFIAIKQRNFVQHKEWMIRSYVVTFAFVVFRLVVDSLAYLEIGDRSSNATTMAWACWVVPLLLTEMVLQGRKLAAR